MFDFCYGKFSPYNCYYWARHLPAEDAVILIALILVGIFVILRLIHWIVGDFDIW